MKIVLVEDDENKRREIAEFVRDALPKVVLVERASFQSGLKSILQERPSLVLLDMSMPTFDVLVGDYGGRARPFAGIDILKELQRRGIKCRVVVVTQFESFGEGVSAMTLGELKGKLQASFPSLYLGTVFYSASRSEWRDSLRRYIERCAEEQ